MNSQGWKEIEEKWVITLKLYFLWSELKAEAASKPLLCVSNVFKQVGRLTLTCRLHARGRVDCVSKKTIARHLVSNHSCCTGTLTQIHKGTLVIHCFWNILPGHWAGKHFQRFFLELESLLHCSHVWSNKGMPHHSLCIFNMLLMNPFLWQNVVKNTIFRLIIFSLKKKTKQTFIPSKCKPLTWMTYQVRDCGLSFHTPEWWWIKCVVQSFFSSFVFT